MLRWDMLNSILPPRVLKNDAGDDLIQYMSATPAARSDICEASVSARFDVAAAEGW
jgi:hypothetical protein